MQVSVIAGAAIAGLCLGAGSVAAQQPTLGSAVAEDLGAYITGPDGRPVYAFRTELVGGDEQPALISCGEDCLENWPHVTVEGGEISVGEGLDPELAAVLTWEGKPVAVYNSHALFYFFRDEPGEPPEGHGIHSYGGWWQLLRPDGELVEAEFLPARND